MKLFRSLFGSKKLGPPALEPPGTHLAFVMLEKPVLPSEESLRKSLATYSGPDEAIRLVDDDGGREAKEPGPEVMIVQLEGIGSAFVALMPAPIPNGEAEASFDFSMSSFAEGASLASHQAHLIVTLAGIDPDCAPLKALMAFTSLLAAVVEASPSVGVYWGNAGATHSKEFFLSMAAEREVNPRLLLWNGISRASEPGGKVSLLSYGMGQLALPDLYFVCDLQQAGDAMGRFFDLLAYVASRGEAIPDGDTIGASEQERIPVKYVQSPADSSKVVWRVEF